MVYPDRAPLDAAFVAAVAAHGGSARLARVMAARGIGPGEVDRFFRPARESLHDPALLPDVAVAVERIRRANGSGEGVLVVGDFDADGLTGLAIMVRALRRVGIDAAWHVPSRLDDGHGLSLRAVELARAGGHGRFITVDMGSSSGAEIAAAGQAGIAVIVTDHHRVPPELPPAIAVVNPHRPDSAYPDARLTGSGVALKVAPRCCWSASPGSPSRKRPRTSADLATIGTVADVAPVLGEKPRDRAPRAGADPAEPAPGIAALLARRGRHTRRRDPRERLGSPCTCGSTPPAASGTPTWQPRSCSSDDAAEAAIRAAALDAANLVRRDVSRASVDEARALLEAEGGEDGGCGLSCAARGRSASSASSRGGSRRMPGCPPLLRRRGGAPPGLLPCPAGYDLAAALERCADLLAATAAHRGAAGFEVEAPNWDALVERLRDLLASSRPADVRPRLILDLALPAGRWTMRSFATSTRPRPYGSGEPRTPVVGVHGLTVTRIPRGRGRPPPS